MNSASKSSGWSMSNSLNSLVVLVAAEAAIKSIKSIRQAIKLHDTMVEFIVH